MLRFIGPDHAALTAPKTGSAGDGPEAPAAARHSSARPLGFSFGASAFILGLTLVTGILLARVLGPEGRGQLAIVLLWPGLLAAVGSIGMPDATTYFAARSSGHLGTLVGSSMIVGLVQSALLVGVGAVIVPLVHSGAGSHTRGVAYLALGYIPLYLLTLYLMNILNGLHRFTSFQALRLTVFAGTGILLVGLAAVHHLDVKSATLATLAAHLAAGIGAAALVARAGASPLGFDRELTRDLLGFGLSSHLGGVSAMLNERLDQLVISIFLVPAKLGLYVVAVSLMALTNLVGQSVSLIALPAIASLAPGKERTDLARRLVCLTAIASAAVSIPMILLTNPLIHLFFGEAFLSTTDVSRVLLLAAVLLSTNRALSALLKAVGRPLDAGLAEIVALVITVATLAILLPTIGLMGAAIASLLAYGVSTAWMLRRTAQVLEVDWTSLLLPSREDLRLLRHRPLSPTPAREVDL